MFNEYDNCISCIQKAVDELAEKMYSDDECKPKFTVSEMNSGSSDAKILLTIEHLVFVHTETLFPNGYFGNKPISETMKSLYNSTM